MSEDLRIRNVAFVGPHHSGKTTLLEALLFACGAIARRGSVTDGSTTTDCEPEDIAHAQSTCVGFARATHDSIEINLIDTPGFIDFFEETRAALRGVDAAVVVVEADPSRIALTHALMEEIDQLRLPHIVVINKLDRPGADFNATLAELQRLYGRHVVAEQLPIRRDDSLVGFIDLATMQGTRYSADGDRSEAIEPEFDVVARQSRRALLEAMADFDDRLMQELLDDVEPPTEEVDRDLCDECAHDQIVPVLVASGLHGFGITALLRAIERWFPAPVGEARAPIRAQVIKTIVHPQSGKLSVARIHEGTLTSDATLIDLRTGERLRVGGLYRLFGKKSEPISSAGPGSIVAIARLEGVLTGSTLAGAPTVKPLPPIEFAPPVFAVAIKPKERIDEAKISQMLARIIEEDPSLQLARAQFTSEQLLLGCGEQHVGIAIERLARKHRVEIEVAPPAIPYLETISGSTEVHSRYKHQTGGHGQFADVQIRFAPRPRGSGLLFDDEIVGGVVPKNFIPAVEKGVREALARGTSGYPVTDLRVTLFDGQYHDVDSSEQSFRTAASMAVRDALPKCKPIVLEPIARVEVTIPPHFTATVIGQLTAKRGQILGMKPSDREGREIVEADVPLVELARYITELRTATQGLGTYRWSHERYDPAPPGRVPTAAVS
uniref:Elongation factor G-like protein n=1 Tax=mine drainage metagenome TaxID=410659 RepID=E6Q6U0_9ZZZZ